MAPNPAPSPQLLPDPVGVAAGIVRAVAAGSGWDPPPDLRVEAVRPVVSAGMLADPSARPTPVGPMLLGQAYEAALAPEARAAGAHYTPADVAAGLVALVVPPDLGPRRAPHRIWDPACGGGAFLLAAADALVAAGVDPVEVVEERLWGTDVDPGAVAVAEAALVWWAHGHGVDARPGAHLGVGDALLDVDVDGPLSLAAASGFDVVLGNPPFQGQLAGASVRSAVSRAELRSRWGAEVVQPYTDTATLFLVAGARALAPGGRLLLIQPASVLAARDAAASRAAAAAVAPLEGLWLDGEPVFGAEVSVCAVSLRRPTGPPSSGPSSGHPETHAAAEPATVRRWRGRAVDPVAVSAGGTVASLASSGSAGGGPSWAGYALAALGVPDPPARWSGRLGSIATARAGFRDEYYGLVGHVVEASLPGRTSPTAAAHLLDADQLEGLDARWAPLVTSGLIDVGRCAWGDRPVRFARERFSRPVVDLPAVLAAGGRAAAWVDATRAPKVVVATQTRVGEAAVDPTGRWVASTPTVAVLAPVDRLWEVAAVICSPVGSLAALAATAGAARARDAIRHSVTSVAGLPLPVDAEAWSAGAAALRARDRSGFVHAMAAAYGLPPGTEADDWWLARAPWPT